MTLNFIDKGRLYSICEDVISVINNASSKIDDNMHRNIIDPFSAIFEASFNKISLTDWLKQEKLRQLQKTLQNAIGSFHQKILGGLHGWQDLGRGNVADIINIEKKIVAEIKNKFNTTKGNHKIAIYDDLDNCITKKYHGYVGYYVSILTKNFFNRPFTPSDNKTHTRRPKNERIREIDGASFYDIATGEKDSIRKLYFTLPSILADINNIDENILLKDPLFRSFFDHAFS